MRVPILLLLFLTSCAGLPRSLVDPAERFAFGDCSIGVPGTGGWALVDEGDAFLLFELATGDPGRRAFAIAVLRSESFADLESYRDFLAQDALREGARLRQPSAEFTVVHDPLRPYVRGRYRVEDHGVPGAEGRVFETISDSRFFLHPDGFRTILLTVSQRLPLGEQPLKLDDVTHRFFSSVEWGQALND